MNYRSSVEITCLHDAIKSLVGHSDNKSFVVEVRLSHIVEDSMREARKKKFNPTRLLK